MKSQVSFAALLVTLIGVFSPAVGQDDFDWFPTSIQTSRDFSYDLATLLGVGQFELVEGPRGLSISKEGAITWYAGNGFQGTQKLILKHTDAKGKETTYRFKMLVGTSPPRKIQSAVGSRDETAIDAAKGHKILELPQPGGWTMSADGVTLIVSLPNDAQLVYFDTLNDKEVKRIDVDFQPTSLALQGNTLFAAAKGSSIVYALDAKTGEVQKEIFAGGDAIAHLACHASKGLVYATTVKFRVHAIDPKSGKASLTRAAGHFIAVDPIDGDFVYTGIQPRDRKEVIIEETARGEFRIYFDRWGPRSVLMKYEVAGNALKLTSAQDNAAVNGWWMHLTPDGKRIMMVGGGGWRPKDEGSGGGYITAIFSTGDLKARVGELPSKLNAVFHPTLDLGIINDYGVELIPFKRRSLAPRPATPITESREQCRTISLLTFGGRGSKVILWNGNNIGKEQGLHFIPLSLTDKDRDLLAKAKSGAVETGGDNTATPTPVANDEKPLRKWTDSTGKFSVEATFVTQIGKNVKLKKPDGKTITVPLDRLSEKDQAYVRGLGK